MSIAEFLVSFLAGGMVQLLVWLFGLLPTSDLVDADYFYDLMVEVGLDQFLGYLNFFLPIGEMATFFAAWVVAIVAFNAAHGFIAEARQYVQRFVTKA